MNWISWVLPVLIALPLIVDAVAHDRLSALLRGLLAQGRDIFLCFALGLKAAFFREDRPETGGGRLPTNGDPHGVGFAAQKNRPLAIGAPAARTRFFDERLAAEWAGDPVWLYGLAAFFACAQKTGLLYKGSLP